MLTLIGVLCRICKCTARATGGQAPRSKSAGTEKESDQSAFDDLTVIHGIGIASQDRLYTAGIKTFAQLARATPEDVRRILGQIGGGAKVEDWINEAGDRDASSAATK